MKVFALNDCDWWAAETLDEAKSHYLTWTGQTEEDEPFDDPYELDAEAMSHFKFNDEDGSQRTFQQQLDRMVSSGVVFPCFFASTEC